MMLSLILCCSPEKPPAEGGQDLHLVVVGCHSQQHRYPRGKERFPSFFSHAIFQTAFFFNKAAFAPADHNLTGGDTMSALNDPRVFFAAERTLLAWTRTSLTLMAFGFVVERFGLFIQMLLPQQSETLQRGLSFWIGLSFIILGAFASIAAVVQYRRFLRTLKPEEIPVSYLTHLGSWANLIVAILGVALSAYLFRGSLL
jgi:putative membrane protein